jgi:YgiT-type zinc finger domain-containing protein
MDRQQDKETTVRCAVCKGETSEQLIRYVQDFEGRVVIVENVPADVCAQCGEKYVRPDVAEKIQRLVWERPAPKTRTEVSVYDLAEVA